MSIFFGISQNDKAKIGHLNMILKNVHILMSSPPKKRYTFRGIEKLLLTCKSKVCIDKDRMYMKEIKENIILLVLYFCIILHWLLILR